ncbi:hypothetical protein H5410_056016 [Solanum commersonii]|uniref:Uncharacterized protein n=1 Tax=Solanum commersonii TaxID=4109 RepID=A0A9J5WK17_SOLCO|nr:hypothetical protein H5410_056016 [Solanum commersonii]
MGHSNIWNAHPKNYGPGSRTWCVVMSLLQIISATVCVEIHMLLLGSMDSCAAGSASAAMPRKLVSLSTADRGQFQ